MFLCLAMFALVLSPSLLSAQSKKANGDKWEKMKKENGTKGKYGTSASPTNVKHSKVEKNTIVLADGTKIVIDPKEKLTKKEQKKLDKLIKKAAVEQESGQ